MANNSKHGLKVLLLLGVVAYALGAAFFTYSWSPGPNYRNISIDTTVNITNAFPEVLNVIIDGGATNITLNAGSVRFVDCNTTIRDFNGGSSIANVTATFYYNATANQSSPDSNNTHYTNASCALGSFDATTRNATCTFPVRYYANNGRWICNVSAIDSYAFNESVNASSSNYNTTNIDALLALNVTTLIDYGNLAVGDTSTPQEANVTNLGNRNINISVRGYGNVTDDGLAMYCQYGNISVQHEKFNLIGGTNLSLYTNLSSSLQNITGLIVGHQLTPTAVLNTTYWVLYVPPNPFGRCNGTIVFQAELGNDTLF